MSHEINTTPYLDNLSVLQDARFEAAIEKSEQQMLKFFAVDRAEDPHVEATKVFNDGFDAYAPTLRPAEVMSYEALGISLGQARAARAASTNEGPAELLTTLREDGQTLSVLAHMHGIKIRFSIDDTPDAIGDKTTPMVGRERIKQRFASSPPYQALTKAHHELADAAFMPAHVTIDSFDPQADPLGTLAFLEDIGLKTDSSRDLAQGETPAAIVNGLVESTPPDVASRHDTETATILTWGIDLKKTLAIDKETGSFTFTAHNSVADLYLEQASRQVQAEAIPFVETECAKEICHLLDQAGLMFNPALQIEMTRAGASDLHGSIYTQMTREIAKWVNRPSRGALANIFVPVEDGFYGKQVVEKNRAYKDAAVDAYKAKHHEDQAALEDDARKRWQSIPHEAATESAATLFSLIDQALARPTNEIPRTDLAVTAEDIRMKTGACFDVTTYYIGAAGGSRSNAWLLNYSENGVALLKKTTGEKTFMTTHPIVFNGVELPQGALLSKQEDGWAFLRLTPFSFDKPEDQVAAGGSELSKALKNEADTLRAVGGTTLKHIMAGAY